jgi:AcrR family transcriptional regulator
MQQRSQATRAAIVAAALHLFAKEGYDGSSVAEICTTAGVSKGAFYHHFASKQALFISLMEDWLDNLDKQIAQAVQQARDVPQGLVQMAGLTGQVFTTADGSLPMILEFWRAAMHNPEIWQAAVAPYRRYRQMFTQLIEHGVSEGSFAQLNAQDAAQVVVALAVGLLLQSMMDPASANWPDVARQGLQWMTAGMQHPQA